MFVATNITRILSRQKYACCDKMFVATKLILVAAAASDNCWPCTSGGLPCLCHVLRAGSGEVRGQCRTVIKDDQYLCLMKEFLNRLQKRALCRVPRIAQVEYCRVKQSALLQLASATKKKLLAMALSRPFKEDRLALPLSTPLSSRRSMV